MPTKMKFYITYTLSISWFAVASTVFAQQSSESASVQKNRQAAAALTIDAPVGGAREARRTDAAQSRLARRACQWHRRLRVSRAMRRGRGRRRAAAAEVLRHGGRAVGRRHRRGTGPGPGPG